MLPIQRKCPSDEKARYHLFPLGLFLPLFLPLFWRWFERAAPLVCWIVIIAASTISDLLILW